MVRSKDKKVPQSAIDRKDEKVVKTTAQNFEKRPVWRFSSVDRNGPFKWPKGEAAELEIVTKLHEFDSMLWSDIEGKQHHFLAEGSLSDVAKRRLQAIHLDDEIDQLFSFHLQGKPRIIVIRHMNIASLLWYDPEHGVAPSTKKHT